MIATIRPLCLAGPQPDEQAHVEAARALQWLRATLPPTADLHTDSREIRPGDGFMAFAVQEADNRPHIGDAIARGAGAIVVQAADAGSRGANAADAGGAVPMLAVAGLPVLAGVIASNWYGAPSETMPVIGVTGTNGKTSTTQWIATALGASSVKTAVIGTLGVGFPDKLVPTGFTTPNAPTLQHCLADLRDAGAAAIAMEVSSHALHQGRVNGTAFDIAVFTNLTQDHLDYHRTLEAYEAAKATLFDWPSLRFAVVNRDDAAGRRLLRRLDGKLPVLAFGIGAEQAALGDDAAASLPATYWLRATDVRSTPAGGTALTLHAHGGALGTAAAPATLALEVATLGEFNVSNLLGVLGALLAYRGLTDARAIDVAALTDAAGALSLLQPVVGRMQRVNGPGTRGRRDEKRAERKDEPLVVVDYAHTPDALEKTLLALRPVAAARGGALIVVFGCGGDRDATKRPLMGAIARRLADTIVLTSDNPRTESPAAIIDQIAVGAMAEALRANGRGSGNGGNGGNGSNGGNGGIDDGSDSGADTALRRIDDRASAILQTIRAARADDVVLLAGKGHEATQDIMGKKRPFSDQEHAQLALAARATHQRGETA